jgi:hypothetical protein
VTPTHDTQEHLTMDTAIRLWIAVAAARARALDLARDEAGEGVISTAIAVLIMALIGAAMWVAFSGVFDAASERTIDNVNQIGG